MAMKDLTKEMVTFKVNCLPECESITNALSFESTGADHSEYITKVVDDNGFNPWLWCAVEVVAEFKGIRGSAYLGQCAYENEEGFKAGGYYEQMQNEAFVELKSKVDDIINTLIPKIKTIAIVWSTEDVKSKAETLGIKLNDNQAYQILLNVEQQHDANLGITWETIEYSIKAFMDFNK